MEHSTLDVDEILKRRYWLKENFDWFMNEVVRHREMKHYFSQESFVVWKFGDDEGRVEVSETTSGSD